MGRFPGARTKIPTIDGYGPLLGRDLSAPRTSLKRELDSLALSVDANWEITDLLQIFHGLSSQCGLPSQLPSTCGAEAGPGRSLMGAICGVTDALGVPIRLVMSSTFRQRCSTESLSGRYESLQSGMD